VADDLERPAEPAHEDSEQHLPAPSILPFAFAGGIALILIGLIINWWLAVAGGVLALLFGFAWIREVTRDVRAAPEPEPVVVEEPVSELAAEEEEGPEEPERYPRSVFLELSTLGIGAAIGALVTVPALGFMIAPAFVGQGDDDVDLGPLDNFPEQQYVIAQFNSKKDEPQDVGRRAAFIRNNGRVDEVPSFTIISNRCVHLGCPVQANGPTTPEKQRTYLAGQRKVTYTPVLPAGFGCPCHGGQYNTEGNRTAGPPVRALDRWAYKVVDGRLRLVGAYSVDEVEGSGADATMGSYRLAQPGVHIDGLEQILYPLIPPS
jgi:quinol---cytochrome c reductase iron-sulfur subunit, bacillus type